MYIFYWRWYINSQSWYINTCILSKWQLYYYVRITYMFADMYTDWKGAYTYIHILGHLYDSFIGSHGSYSATPLRTTKLLRSLSHINIYIYILISSYIIVYHLYIHCICFLALPTLCRNKRLNEERIKWVSLQSAETRQKVREETSEFTFPSWIPG